MSREKTIKYIAGMSIVSIIACSMMLTVAAQANTDPFASWQPPKDFVDPVTLKIQDFKSQGLTDEQITAKLTELGMGWFPKTGATWLGRALTVEELAEMPTTIPIETPSSGDSVTTQVGRISYMVTSSASWTGVASEVVSGSMSVASGQTNYHYLCVQLGDLAGATNWAETVLTHNYGQNYRWNTFDSDEGGMTYYKDKDTAITAADTYTIMLDGTYNNGWKYDVWINYNWVRSGHLSSLWAQAGFQKEVYSDSGSFTNDASHAVFYRNWLHNANGWSYWTNSVGTSWTPDYPVRESHSMGALSYRWETWVQN